MKTFLKFSLFFIFVYIQPLTIGFVKISFLTMGAIYIFVIYKFINTKKNSFNNLSKYSLLYPIKSFASFGIYNYFFKTIFDLLKELTFYFIYSYSINFFSREDKIKYLYFLSIFFITSFIPFSMNIIEPINSGYELSEFSTGLNDQLNGYIGIFENSHSASITLALSLIFIIYIQFFSKVNSYFNANKVIITFVIIFGIFALYKTYVRTGYLMFISGMSVLLFTKIKFTNVIKYLFIVVLVVVSTTYLVRNDETLKNRLFDTTQYSSGKASEEAGSGRIIFQYAALKIWLENDILEKVFGTGIELFADKMNSIVGIRIYSHNGFTTELVKNGIIGLTLFSMFMINIFTSSYYNFIQEKDLCLAVAIAYLLYQMVQGGAICPEMEIMLGLIFSLTLNKVANEKKVNFVEKLLVK